MDKKKIIISVSLIVFMIVVILIYNLVIKKKNENNNNNTYDQNIINEPTNKSVITRTTGTTLCRSIYNNNLTILFTAKNDKIVKTKFTSSRRIENFDYENINILSNEDKKAIESKILKELGLESFEYKGINISVDFKDEVFLTIDVDYSSCDLSIIEKLNIKFKESYSDTIKGILSSKEYKCE